MSSSPGAALAAASSGVFHSSPSGVHRNSPAQQQNQHQQHIDVLFVGKRDDAVPAAIAIAAGQPCRGVPKDWVDTHTIECDLPAPGGTGEMVPATFHVAADAAAVHERRPQVVVLCYTPCSGLAAAKAQLDEWSLEVRTAQQPRPTMLLLACKTEKVHSHTDPSVTPVSAAEACDLFVRTRAATYMEVSAELGVHLRNAAESVAHAALFEAERRPTPEIVRSLRDHVLVAAFAGAKWLAKRHARTNRIVYMNRQTRKMQYEQPADFDGIEPELTEEEKRERAAAELSAKERRARLERERQLDEAYMADVHIFEERMRSLEKAFEDASKRQTEYEKEVQQLRRQMAENSELLRRLQQQHDMRIRNKSSFVSSAAEKDSMMEKELQAHRERLFELEAAVAQREEKEDDVHLMELSVDNRKLASDLRACLRKQLDTQRGLAAMQARAAELARESEQLAVKHMRLRAKQHESRSVMEQGSDELAALRQRLGALEKEIDRVVNAEIAEASSQALRQKQLLRAIAHAEKALRDARGSSTMIGRKVVDEHERLRSEQQRLVGDVTAAAAATAQWELRVRRALAAFQALSHDLQEVLDGLHGASVDFATLVQTAVAEVQWRNSGSGGGAAGGGGGAAGSPLKGRGGAGIGAAAAAGGVSSPGAASGTLRAVAAASVNATPLEEKMIALHRAALATVRESHRDVLRRQQRSNDVAEIVAEIFDGVLSIPDSNAPPIAETLPPTQRLLAKCDTAIRSATSTADAARLRDDIVRGFESHLRQAVTKAQAKETAKSNAAFRRRFQ